MLQELEEGKEEKEGEVEEEEEEEARLASFLGLKKRGVMENFSQITVFSLPSWLLPLKGLVRLSRSQITGSTSFPQYALYLVYYRTKQIMCSGSSCSPCPEQKVAQSQSTHAFPTNCPHCKCFSAFFFRVKLCDVRGAVRFGWILLRLRSL